MATTDPGTLLDRMGAKVTGRRVMLHVIGSRLKDHESGRSVPMLADCPPFVTWAIGSGFVAPSKDQQTRCLAYWIKEPRAPSVFVWKEGEQPQLRIEKKPRSKKPTSHTEEIDDDVAG